MNLTDPSTRKRTLYGFPVSGCTKQRDIQDDLNEIAGVLLVRTAPHFEQALKGIDFVIQTNEDFDAASLEKVRALCAPFQATYKLEG